MNIKLIDVCGTTLPANSVVAITKVENLETFNPDVWLYGFTVCTPYGHHAWRGVRYYLDDAKMGSDRLKQANKARAELVAQVWGDAP